MRITTDNIQQLVDAVENLTDAWSDMESDAQSWLEAQDSDEADPEDTAASREQIESYIDSVIDAARTICTIDNKWAFYESGLTKKLKARIEELEAQLALKGAQS